MVNDPVNLVDPEGLWSVSGDLYTGVGAGFTVGYDPYYGRFFVNSKIGIGAGGGVSFDPNGGFPRPSEEMIQWKKNYWAQKGITVEECIPSPEAVTGGSYVGFSAGAGVARIGPTSSGTSWRGGTMALNYNAPGKQNQWEDYYFEEASALNLKLVPKKDLKFKYGGGINWGMESGRLF